MQKLPLKNEQAEYIWISVAETSADYHGARLIQAISNLEPKTHLIGMGGPEMRKTDFQAIFNAEELSVMGLTEVLASLPKALSILQRTKQILGVFKPKCLILIDAPDFNFRLAKTASKMNIPVYYYITPQVWAWRRGRIKFLKKHVQKLFCILPFEKDFYLKNNMPAEYVGHPLLQQLDLFALDQISFEDNLLGILPGSRKKEISALLPSFSQAADLLKKKRPELKILLFKAPNIENELIKQFWYSEHHYTIIDPEKRYEQIKHCTLVFTASGTASLECALLGTPAIVAYKVSWPSYWIGRMVIQVPFISMPNLILNKKVFPELIQNHASPSNLAEQALTWLENPEDPARIRKELKGVRQALAQKDASQTVARLILDKTREHNMKSFWPTNLHE